MKKLLLLFLISTFMVSFSWAQREVSGTVTGADEGLPLPGVSILIVGTTTGTVTDADGNYKLAVPSSNAVLRYSYIGYVNQEITVGNQSVIDVVLAPDATQLQEVVVTSLGIERETKALNYSITEVDGEKFTQARENNLANQLTGRVAGVNVTNVAGGPASSTRVIIRGNKSLEGNNQPLYVVDGIPMDNSTYGQAGIWGGRDEGDGMTSINPDDIASIEVLKGANAAALYGARAANGVINITTKKGSARKGVGVEFNSNFVFETIYDMRELQREYGQGNYVSSDPSNPDAPRISVTPRDQTEGTNWNIDSWGPRLGSGTFVNHLGQTLPYVDAGDQFPEFFQTGTAWTNSLAFSGGSATQNFRLSLSDLRSEGQIPNSAFDRFNATLSTNSKFGEKLSLNAKLMYSHEESNNRPRLSDSPSNAVLSMYYIPANQDINLFRGDPNKLGAIPGDADPASLQIWQRSPGEEMQKGSIGNNWHQNPWWVAYQQEEYDTRDRLLGSVQLQYDITDWLWLRGRAGMDWYTRLEEEITPQGTGWQRGGSMNERERRQREINLEWLIGHDNQYGPISVNVFAGGNMMRRNYEEININGQGFTVPFEEFINNTVTRTWGYGFNESGINSLFGSAEIGYNGIFYITATGRNDWFSVLNPENNSIFYPSIGGSFVFSDALNTLPSWFSFGKVRASWAQVGNVTVGPYQVNPAYSISGNTHLGYQMGGFNFGTIPNPDLLPLTSTELEIGTDLRFFQDRLGVDFTWYSQRTTDDILRATISRTSGFGSTFVNVGEITNKGIEVLLYGTPVRGAFTWDVSINFARNVNEVVDLLDPEVDGEELVLEEPRTRNVFIKHIEGYPYGMITGFKQKTTPEGVPVFEANGAPVRGDGYEIIGYGVPDFTGGVENTFTWKGINMSFLVDFKSGGDIFSGTNLRLTQSGLTDYTLLGRDGNPLSVVGAIKTGETSGGEPIYEDFEYTLTPSEARNYWGQMGNNNPSFFTYDASFIKLRQLTLGYSFPTAMLSKTPFTNLTLSFVGRNLWIIKKNTPNIDPEASYTSSNSQGLDYFGMPSVRSWGFNLRLAF